MKTSRLFFQLLSILLLTSSKCNKEGNNCHHFIRILNNSENKVLWGTVSNGNNGCRINVHEIGSGVSDEYSPYNSCIENRMSSNEIESIYIVDPSYYNLPNDYYSCDSIYSKNKILKHFELSLEDLKSMDFTISYP